MPAVESTYLWSIIESKCNAMAKFIYGINPYTIDPQQKEEFLKAVEEQKLDELLENWSTHSGPHILPTLLGVPEELAVVRQRYADLLMTVFSMEERKAALKSALEGIAAASSAEIHELFIEGASIDCHDWLPDWFCDWWNDDGDGDGGDDGGDDDDWPPPDEDDLPNDDDTIETSPLCFDIYPDGSVQSYWHEDPPNIS